MPTLRLAVLHLPPNELALVKVFFRLFSGHPDFAWELVESLPADAVLVDSAATVLGGKVPLPNGLPTLWVDDHKTDANSASHIPRPLRSDRLEAWLNRVGAELALNAGQARPAFGQSPEEQAGQSAIREAAPSTGRLILSRWPPAILLRKDPVRIRLATMMMRKGLSLNEMSRLSAWPAGKVEEFVDALKGVGLIQMQYVAGVPGLSLASPSSSPAHPKPALSLGFFERFRRKLGL